MNKILYLILWSLAWDHLLPICENFKRSCNFGLPTAQLSPNLSGRVVDVRSRSVFSVQRKWNTTYLGSPPTLPPWFLFQHQDQLVRTRHWPTCGPNIRTRDVDVSLYLIKFYLKIYKKQFLFMPVLPMFVHIKPRRWYHADLCIGMRARKAKLFKLQSNLIYKIIFKQKLD